MNIAIYWAARTAIFLAVFLTVFATGWRNIYALLFAVVVGWLIAYISLRPLKEKAEAQVAALIAKRVPHPNMDEEAEDAEAEGK